LTPAVWCRSSRCRIQYQYRQPVAGQVLDSEVVHRVHRAERVPRCAFAQSLHAIGGAVPGVLGEGSTVLARQVKQQPSHVLAACRNGSAMAAAATA